MDQTHLSSDRRLSIAIIGTGIAGMSAAWLLNQRHRITVYEKNAWIGGHSNTVDAPLDSGVIPVDTGFIVYNDVNYPNLTALFDFLDVPTRDSNMSFAASLGGGALEYAGTDLNGLFGQRANALRPRFWLMVSDLLRFYREAPGFLSDPEADEVSLGAFLRTRGFSHTFINSHILPMGAAIWSTTPREMLDYPAAAFIRFFQHHGLLRLTDRPQWRTVVGGSREYVRRLTASYRDAIRFGGVRSVRRIANKVLVEGQDGQSCAYDHVVIAAHADEAFRLLSDPDPMEASLMGQWRYTRNRAVLHSDPGLMPRRRRVWSSWNFIGGRGERENENLCVTYWMNRLQSLDPRYPLFVTLNPVREPAPGTVIREFEYTHPYFDRAALAAQNQLWSLQGHRRTWYCGSYFGYGFHEDALQAGLAVAEQLGEVRRPWNVKGESDRINLLSQARAPAA
ncbi:MAG: FAD-dependent oxidoreductase [Rhodospirillales bacterium]|nr:MAG: FAD-dependent oxidoreductase [Rhodospirillales bacterium]